jgi:hypothetical protein
MRSNTQTVSIEAPAAKVQGFVADGHNLPKWAAGFARSVTPRDGGWIVTTGSGEMAVRIESSVESGTVDFWLRPAPGVEVLAAARVVPRGAASEFVFTQFQPPGMTDVDFEKNVQAVAHELKILKALLEVECPL